MPRRLQFDLRLGSDSDQRGLRAVAGCDSETQAADGNYRYKRPFVMVALNVSTRGRLHSVGHSSLNFSGMNLTSGRLALTRIKYLA